MNKKTKGLFISISAAVIGIIAIATAAFFLLRGNSWTKEDVKRVEDKYMHKSDAQLIKEFGNPATVRDADGDYFDRTYKTWDNTDMGKGEKVMLTLVKGKIYNVTSGKQEILNRTIGADEIVDSFVKESVTKITNILDEYSDELSQLDDLSALNLGESSKYLKKGSDGKWAFDSETFVDDLLQKKFN